MDLVRDEQRRHPIRIYAEPVITDDEIVAILVQYTAKSPPLCCECTKQQGKVRTELWKEETAGTVWRRVIRKINEPAVGKLPLQGRQRIAAGSEGDVMTPLCQFVDDRDIPRGMTQTPVQRRYQDTCHRLSTTPLCHRWGVVAIKGAGAGQKNQEIFTAPFRHTFKNFPTEILKKCSVPSPLLPEVPVLIQSSG